MAENPDPCLSSREDRSTDIHAARCICDLRDKFMNAGLRDSVLEIVVARVLFCLFAENDPCLFQDCIFSEYILDHFKGLGNNKAATLQTLFKALSTPKNKRRHDDSISASLPYINNNLFRENTEIPPLKDENDVLRNTLIECRKVKWQHLKPEIFGSIYQDMMISSKRREHGVHYTGSENILKVIKPLFLDTFEEELHHLMELSKSSIDSALRLGVFGMLKSFREKLGKVRFLDPACGCGNFLIVAFREMRSFELKCLQAIKDVAAQIINEKHLFPTDEDLNEVDKFNHINTMSNVFLVKLKNFSGYEIMDCAARIASVALIICKHQEDRLAAVKLGGGLLQSPLPLEHNDVPVISIRDSLVGDWDENFTFIIGNPPYVGHYLLSDDQCRAMRSVFSDQSVAGLDYVLCWFKKACDYLERFQSTRFAFVSTSSITEGEQPKLWSHFLDDLRIFFARKSFKWMSEIDNTQRPAQVSVIIIGVEHKSMQRKTCMLFTPEQLEQLEVREIDARLNPVRDVDVDSSLFYLQPETTDTSLPYSVTVKKGWVAADDKGLFLMKSEAEELQTVHPFLDKYIFDCFNASDLMTGRNHSCLVFESSPQENVCEALRDRFKKVESYRKESKRVETQKKQHEPWRFLEMGPSRRPTGPCIAWGKTGSANRKICLPIFFLDALNEGTVLLDGVFFVNGNDKFLFGVLQSAMHQSWILRRGGKLKNDPRYTIPVFRDFPWPIAVSDEQNSQISEIVDSILAARRDASQSMRDMYRVMDTTLREAHDQLDRVVDRFYRKEGFSSNDERADFIQETSKQLNKKLGISHPSRKKRKAVFIN